MNPALQPSPELLFPGSAALMLAGVLIALRRGPDRLRWILVLTGAQTLWLSYLARPDLGIDGGLSLTLALLPLPEMARINAADVHPPAYYALLHGWVSLAGLSPLAVRYTMVLAGIAAVATIGAAGRRLGGPAAGQFAALVVSLVPGVALLSTTVRDFMPGLALAGLAVCLWLGRWPDAKFAAAPPGRLATAGLGLVLAAGLWTTYFFGPLIAALGLASVVGGRRLVRHWFLATAVGGLLWLPWLIYEIPRFLDRFFAGQSARTEGMAPDDPLYFLRETALALAGIGRASLGAIEWLVLVAFLTWCGIIWWRMSRSPVGDRRPLALGVVATPLVLVSCYLLMRSWANITAIERYVIFVLPFLAPAFGIALDWPRGWVRWAGLGLATAIGASALAGSWHLLSSRYQPGSGWHPVATVEVLDTLTQADDTLIFVSLEQPSYYQALSEQPAEWRVVPVLPSYVAGDIAANAQRQLAPLLNEPGTMWVVTFPHDVPNSELVLNWLRDRAYPAQEEWTPDSKIYGFVPPRADSEVHDLEAVFADGIVLRSASFPQSIAAGSGLPVQLRWAAQLRPTVDYTVFVHLVTPEQTSRVTGHDGTPFGGQGATRRWEPGAEYLDPHGLTVPADTSPGEYVLVAGLYRDDNRLRLASGGTQVVLGPVQVTAPTDQPSAVNSEQPGDGPAHQ